VDDLLLKSDLGIIDAGDEPGSDVLIFKAIDESLWEAARRRGPSRKITSSVRLSLKKISNLTTGLVK
jgi:hypothetical protein